MSGFPPAVELTTLYEKTSARGVRYLVGRMGSARLVLLPGNPAPDGTATWRLLVQERTAAATEQPQPAPPPAPTRRPRRHTKPRLVASGGPTPNGSLDDSLADLWPETAP